MPIDSLVNLKTEPWSSNGTCSPVQDLLAFHANLLKSYGASFQQIALEREFLSRRFERDIEPDPLERIRKTNALKKLLHV